MIKLLFRLDLSGTLWRSRDVIVDNWKVNGKWRIIGIEGTVTRGPSFLSSQNNEAQVLGVGGVSSHGKHISLQITLIIIAEADNEWFNLGKMI